MRIPYLVFLVITIGLFFGTNSVFADVTITTATGSGVPGCEETSKECYHPSTAIVNVGDTVIFSNPDSAAHTFTSGTPIDGPDGLFDSGLAMTGSTFEWSPTKTGNVQYFCMVHPWMTSLIIVQGTSQNYVPKTHSAKITSNEIGSVEIEQSIYNISRHENTLVKIFGNILNPMKGSKVAITFTTPEHDSNGQHVFPTDKGYYELYFPLDYNSPEGTYNVLVSYSSSVIGHITFDVIHEDTLSIPPPNTQPLSTTQSVNQNKISIPEGTGIPGCEESSSCYLPFSVYVTAGETVTWSNDDSAAHTVTSGTPADGPDGIFDSSLLMAGGTFSVTLYGAGVYPYFCMVHPWMNGIIDVIGSKHLKNFSNIENDSKCGPGTVFDPDSNSCVLGTQKIIPASEPEPLQIPAPFVDSNLDPQYYVNRYINEINYKEWFDENYPKYTIYEAIGISKNDYDNIVNSLSEVKSNESVTSDISSTVFSAKITNPKSAPNWEYYSINTECEFKYFLYSNPSKIYDVLGVITQNEARVQQEYFARGGEMVEYGDRSALNQSHDLIQEISAEIIIENFSINPILKEIVIDISKNKLSSSEIEQIQNRIHSCEEEFQLYDTQNSIITAPTIRSHDDVPEFGVEVGQWIKYELNFETGSTNDFMHSLLDNQFGKSIGGSDIQLDDIEWMKVKIIDVSGTEITLENEISVIGKNSNFISTATHTYDPLNPLNFFIPIDTKENQLLIRDHTFGDVVSGKFIEKSYDGKKINLIPVTANIKIEETGALLQADLETFYHKNSGMLFEMNMNMNAATFFGGTAFNLELKAIDFYIPSAKTEQNKSCFLFWCW